MSTWRERLLISVGPGLFAGTTFGDWRRLLRENRYAIGSSYFFRAALITANSVLNSCLRWYEEKRFGRRLEGLELRPPLFILGHWRSGTTHLHNFFTRDPRFAYPNLYQVNFPHTFLCTEGLATRLLRLFLPRRRLKDNIHQHLAMANEDELALCGATFRSPYMSSAFPQRQEHYDRYLTFDGVPAREIAEWQQALLLFLRKLTLKYDRPIVLKSPPHTCRIRLLLELFPQARFIHIHRNPYDVFLSSQRQHEAVGEYFRLQRPVRTDLEAFIIRRYKEMYERFFAERKLVPADRFHEVCFEDLEREPLVQLRTIYERLGLPDFGVVEEDFRGYIETLAGYVKNAPARIPEPLRTEIRQAWGRSFEEWHYDS
jgi:hypothetical protein